MNTSIKFFRTARSVTRGSEAAVSAGCGELYTCRCRDMASVARELLLVTSHACSRVALLSRCTRSEAGSPPIRTCA
eukprot:5826416-Prymnesium_polylepis.1